MSDAKFRSCAGEEPEVATSIIARRTAEAEARLALCFGPFRRSPQKGAWSKAMMNVDFSICLLYLAEMAFSYPPAL
jgi:hypothetical protein